MWHMAFCAGIGKSQFSEIGLMVSAGILYCVQPVFLLPEHTKFGPDLDIGAIALI